MIKGHLQGENEFILFLQVVCLLLENFERGEKIKSEK